MRIPGFFTIKNKQTPLRQGFAGQNGQILLIVVLAAVVSLTVGLSAVSRTITNTRVTTEEANSQKALSAAESGVEELVNNKVLLETRGTANPLSKNLSNNSTFNTASIPIQGTAILINDGNQILKDDGADIWFSNYPNFDGTRWSGTLTVLWDNNDDANGCVSGVDPAIEVVVIQGASKDNPDMTRFAFDKCTAARGNNFRNPDALTPAQKTVNGREFDNGVNITIDSLSPGFIARVIPLYANAVMGARSTPTGLPTQGYVIDSVGSSGNTKRTVRVFRGFPRVPIEYFPYNIFLP